MKCNQCGKSSTYLDTSCAWYARCDLLGSAHLIGECLGEENGCYYCGDEEAPAWDCDLGQSNRYCIHHVD